MANKEYESPHVEPDLISMPPHYTSSEAHCRACGCQIEQIDVTQAMDFLEGNIIKYVWRHKLKGGVESLKKARWYLNYLIMKLEKE